MSDTIISARAVPDLDELELALIDYKNTVDNLLKRTEHSLFAGDNAYLAADIGRVIHSLEVTKQHLIKLKGYTNNKKLSANVTATLKRAEKSSLEAMRNLEVIIAPIKDEWTEISQDISRQMLVIFLTLRKHSLDLWMIREISKLSNHSSVSIKSFRSALTKIRSATATINEITDARRQDAEDEMEQSHSQVPILDSSNNSSTSTLTPSEGWSEIGRLAPLSDDQPADATSMKGVDLGYCEGLVVGYLQSLGVAQTDRQTRVPSQLPDSPGRLLLRNACKALAVEITCPVEVTETKLESDNNKEKKDDQTSDTIIDSIKPSYSDTYKCLQSNQSIMSPNATNAVRFAQSNCQKIAQELSTIVNECGVWDVMAPQGSCSRLSVLSVCLREQRMHLDLLNYTLDLSEHLINKPAVDTPATIMPSAPLYCHGGYDKYEMEALNTQNAASQAAENMKNWSETRCRLSAWSTVGIKTPTEDWSDFGSDTTETCRASVITRHSLQLCQNETSIFVKLVGKVEQQFGDAPGSTPVSAETTQYLHEAYGDLVVKLLHGLAAPIPFQSHQTASPAPEIIEPSLPEPQDIRAYVSETLDAIIKSMESPITPTDKEVMKLVFYWTTLDECDGFKREDVMRM
ncbi:hypothetical protein D6D00_06628 [Aureobasidium pullulans]|nr:hypothetical protein D6D00_06628 [Aureobasidium pullulans]